MGGMSRRDRKVAKQTRNAARLTAVASVANVKYTREQALRSRPEPEPAGPKITLRSIAAGVRDRVDPQPQLPPAGWYPDPHQYGGQRYWDGEMWTVHVAPS